MKKILKLFAAALIILMLTLCMALCMALCMTSCTESGNGDGKETTDDMTTTATENVETTEEATTEEATTVEETTTEEATTEEVTTEEGTTDPPELVWKDYDKSKTSEVDKNAAHTVDATQWVATDALGRTLSTNTETGDVKSDKIIAMFYWTWHGDFAGKMKAYNVQEILDEYGGGEEAEKKLWTSITPYGAYHFWDEPVWGYYHGNDEWVIRKQCEMLAAAGVDVIFTDNTNGSYTWSETLIKVMKVFSQARADGINAPKVSVMLPFAATGDATKQINELYQKIYSKGLYEDSWFKMDDKVMLMGYASACPAEYRNFFTFRANLPGYKQTQNKKGSGEWGWLSVFPQALYYDKSLKLEQTTVGVALNANYETGACPYPMNWENAMGRTYTSHGIDSRPNAMLYGACLAEQFENAIAADPEIIFVTGWNEWVAMKLTDWSGTSYTKAFVDEYNDEFSRDIEPSNGFLKDNYYYEFVDYVRQFKGTNAIEKASEAKLIDLTGGFGQWDDVTPAYNDYYGMTNRDFAGYHGLKYKNDTARNDIYDAKVARDYENIYFMVRTVDDLTPYTDANWMRLYIDTTDGGKNNWESFEFIINRQSPASETKTVLEKFTGNGFETETVCELDYYMSGNYMVIKVPKSALGIEGYDFTFSFKWTDNTQNDGDIMDWYNNGDVAPIGRFKYCYTTKGSAAYVHEAKVAGYSLIDFTSKDVPTDVIESLTGAEQTQTGNGLELNVTGDVELTFTYEKSSPMPVITAFPYMKVTYIAEEGKSGSMNLSAVAGKTKLKSMSDGAGEDLICDGQEHTVLVKLTDLSGCRAGGYISYSRVTTDGYNGKLIIKSVQLLAEEDAGT